MPFKGMNIHYYLKHVKAHSVCLLFSGSDAEALSPWRQLWRLSFVRCLVADEAAAEALVHLIVAAAATAGETVAASRHRFHPPTTILYFRDRQR